MRNIKVQHTLEAIIQVLLRKQEQKVKVMIKQKMEYFGCMFNLMIIGKSNFMTLRLVTKIYILIIIILLLILELVIVISHPNNST